MTLLVRNDVRPGTVATMTYKHQGAPQSQLRPAQLSAFPILATPPAPPSTAPLPPQKVPQTPPVSALSNTAMRPRPASVRGSTAPTVPTGASPRAPARHSRAVMEAFADAKERYMSSGDAQQLPSAPPTWLRSPRTAVAEAIHKPPPVEYEFKPDADGLKRLQLPDVATALRQAGLTEELLELAGMSAESSRRLQHALFVYSSGFGEMVQQLLQKCRWRERLAAQLWAAFMLLLEQSDLGLGYKSSITVMLHEARETAAAGEERLQTERQHAESRLHAAREAATVADEARRAGDAREAELARKLDEEREAVRRLEAELEALRPELERERQLRSDAEIKQRAAEAQGAPLAGLAAEVRSLKQRVAAAEGANKRLSDDNREHKSRADSARAELEAERAAVARLESTRERLQEEARKTQLELFEARQEVPPLQEALEVSKAETARAESAVVEARAAADKAKAELAPLQEAKEEAARIRVKQMQTEMELEAKLVQMEESVQEEKERTAEESRKVEEAEQLASDTKALLKQETAALKEAHEQIRTLTERTLVDAREDAQLAVRRAEIAEQKADAAIKQQQQQLQVAASLGNDRAKAEQAAEAKRQETEAQLLAAVSKLEEAEAKSTSAEDKLYRRDLEAAQSLALVEARLLQEREAARAARKEARQLAAALEEQRVTHEAQLRQCGEDMRGLGDALGETAARVQAMHSESFDLNRQLAAAQTQISRLKDTAGDLYQYEVWGQRLSLVEAENAQLREAVEEAGSQLAARVSVLSASDTSLAAVSEQLERALQQAESDRPLVEGARSALAEAQKARDDRAELLEQHAAEVEAFRREAAEVAADQARVRQAHSTVRRNLEVDNRALASRATQLQRHVAQLEREKAVAEDELHKWQDGTIRYTRGTPQLWAGGAVASGAEPHNVVENRIAKAKRASFCSS